MNKIKESQKLKSMLESVVAEVVKTYTKECFRVYKATITGKSSTTFTVQLVGDTNSLTLPFSSKVANAPIGSVVWVATIYNDFRNAIVWETADFK